MIQAINVDEFCEAMQAQVEVVELFKQWSGTDYTIWSEVFDYLEQYDDSLEFRPANVYEAVSVYDTIADFDSHHPHDYNSCKICSDPNNTLEPEDFMQEHLDMYPLDCGVIKVRDGDCFKYIVMEHSKLG